MTIDEILARVTVEVDPHVARLKEGSTGMALVQLGAEVRRLREENSRLLDTLNDAKAEVRRREACNAAGRVLSGIDEMMTSFKSDHSVGYGPNNLEYERLFESILAVLNQVRP